MKSRRTNIIAYIGIIIGLCGFIVGMVVSIASEPVMGSILSLFFILVFGIAFGIPYFRNRKRLKLLKTGRRADAKILDVWDTNITINKQPQIGLRIEVKPQTSAPFVSEIKMIISRLQTSYYQPGMNCVVRYDPEDTKTVAIESIGGTLDGSTDSTEGYTAPIHNSEISSFFPGKTKEQIEALLPNIDAEHERIRRIGVECKGIIKTCQWTNIYVNGNNPLNFYEIAIMPKDLPAYEASCFAFIKQESLGKYQPGKEIRIKYDPLDKSKIAISGN